MNPILINNLEFAAKQEPLAGELRIADCPRLLAEIADKNQAEGRIAYTLTPNHSKLGSPGLTLHVGAAFNVACQRCLEPMPVRLSLTISYIISDIEPSLEDEDDDFDWLPASPHMNLNDLIEDELLLALPIAPTHAYQCVDQKLQSGTPANPFAVLKGRIK